MRLHVSHPAARKAVRNGAQIAAGLRHIAAVLTGTGSVSMASGAVGFNEHRYGTIFYTGHEFEHEHAISADPVRSGVWRLRRLCPVHTPCLNTYLGPEVCCAQRLRSTSDYRTCLAQGFLYQEQLYDVLHRSLRSLCSWTNSPMICIYYMTTYQHKSCGFRG